MALIKCKECGKEFSDKANACPNCACPVEKEKIKVKIYNNGAFSTKCSISIDNLPVGQLGGMLLGKQKDIEISLTKGIHYIGVSTQIEHSGAITGVVGVGQEQDGKQFEILDDDKYIEIEIIPKGSFTGTSGKYCVGEVYHYNSKEFKELQEQEKGKKKSTNSSQNKQNNRDDTKNISKILIIVGISIFALILIISLSSKNGLNGSEKIIYNFLKENGYCSTGGGDTRYGFSVFSKSGSIVGCFNIDLEKIDCKRIPTPLDTKSIYWIDSRKINEKLGCK